MSEPKSLTEPLKESMNRALQVPATFDSEIYHIMEKRDEALISDEILHGSVSAIFVYNFPMGSQGEGNKNVSGISVRGAAHLARHYGGLKHRIVASSDKRGRVFTFKSYPGDGHPMSVHCNIVNELENDPDTYEIVVELADIKTGNSIQVSRLEKRFESRRDGSQYERPNYTVIAESKAFRNAVLRLVPQDVQEEFKKMCIAQGKSIDITASAIDEKRDNVLKFSASKALALTREQVYGLDWNQISGLSDAAREGIEAFRKSAESLGLIAASLEGKKEEAAKTAKKPSAAKAKPADEPKPQPPELVDPNTGEVTEHSTRSAPPPAAQNGASLNFGGE